jgi:hypothetical protein
MRLSSALLLAASLALSGCTTVGVNTKERATVDYGPPASLNVCILRAPGVTPQRVDELMAAVNTEFAPYHIAVVVPWQHPWTRAGFTHTTLFEDVAGRDLEPPCDRLVALVDRNMGDFLWGLFMPEVLGEVDEATHTRGYVVATAGSVNQVLEPPSAGAIHEFYHLLGCPHALALTACYHLIAKLKQHIDPAAGFVPGIAYDGTFLPSRAQTNSILQSALAYEQARHSSVAPDHAQVVAEAPGCDAAAATGATNKSQAGAANPALPQNGRAELCICIDAAGLLRQDPVLATSSGNPDMDGAAIKLARSASGQFRPAVRDGQPVSGCFRFVITFKAQKTH